LALIIIIIIVIIIIIIIIIINVFIDHKLKVLIIIIEKSVLVENRPLVKFIGNYIRDSSGVFSISSLVRISMTSFPTLTLLFVQIYSCPCINKKKLTRWLEDVYFIFLW